MMTLRQQSKVIAAVPHLKAEVEQYQSNDPRNHCGLMLVAQVLMLTHGMVATRWIETICAGYDQ